MRGFATADLLGLLIRIPPGTNKKMLSGRTLCLGLITYAE